MWFRNMYKYILPCMSAGDITLNRFLLLTIYCFILLTTSNIISGWVSFSGLLFKSGAYKWLCKDDDIEKLFFITLTYGGSYSYCKNQDTSVQPLLNVAVVFSYFSFAFGGWMTDLIGPKLTAILGQFFLCLAWILLSFANEFFPVYYLAFAMLGFGAGAIRFPLFSISSLFLQKSAIVIAVCGAAVSGSIAVPLILFSLYEFLGNDNSFRFLCYIYLALGPFLSLLLVILFVPSKLWDPIKSQTLTIQTISPISSKNSISNTSEQVDLVLSNFKLGIFSTKDGHTISIQGKESVENCSIKSFKLEKLNSNQLLSVVESNTSQSTIENETGLVISPVNSSNGEINKNFFAKASKENFPTNPDNCLNSLNVFSCSDLKYNKAAAATISPSALSAKSSVFNHSEKSNMYLLSKNVDSCSHPVATNLTYLSQQENIVLNIKNYKKKSRFSFLNLYAFYILFNTKNTLKKYYPIVSSNYFLLILIFFCSCSCSNTFYLLSEKNVFTENVLSFVDVIMPFTFLFCIIIGIGILKFGVLNMLIFCNTTGVLAFILPCIDMEAGQYISVFCYCIYISAFLSQMIFFIGETFPREHYGKLTGIVILFGGFSSLISIPIYNFIVVGFLNGNPKPVFIGFSIMLIAMYSCLIILKKLKAKVSKPFGE